MTEIEAADKSAAALSRAVDAAFYAAVRMHRALGAVEPDTYHKALETLNHAVKPYNDAYAP